MSSDTPTVTTSRISIEDSMLLFKGMLSLLGACLAFASLIYCYHFANDHWSNFFQGPLVFAGSSLTNLPAGVYLLIKGVACLLEAILDIVTAKHQECLEGQTSDTAQPLHENIPFIEEDQAWINAYSEHLEICTIPVALSKTKRWQKMPYPAELDAMLATALQFNRLYNGITLLSKTCL